MYPQTHKIFLEQITMCWGIYSSSIQKHVCKIDTVNNLALEESI